MVFGHDWPESDCHSTCAWRRIGSCLSWSANAVDCEWMKASAKRPFVRHKLPIAVVSALLAVLPAAFAQRSAGGHFGGFGGGHAHGVAAGGFHGGVSAPRSFGGFPGSSSHGFVAAPRVPRIAPHSNFAPPYRSFVPQRSVPRVYRPALSAESSSAGNHRGRGDRGQFRRPYSRDRDDRYRHAYSGYAYGGFPFPYVNSWELLPWDIGYSDFTGYGDESGTAEQSNAQAPSYEQQQQPAPPPDEGYRQDYASASEQAQAQQPAASTPLQYEPALALIFKDGHTQMIRNYVLTPRDIILMDNAASGRIPRIPLSDLNLPATQQAARKAGLDFSLPSS